MLEKIKDWLQEGLEVSGEIFAWEIQDMEAGEDEGHGTIMASSELGQMEVALLGDSGTLVFPSDIEETTYLDVKSRLKMYRTLLKMNVEVPHATIFLYGEDDDILIKGDFHCAGLDKERLGNILENMLMLRFLIYKTVAEELPTEISDLKTLKFIKTGLKEGKNIEEIADEIFNMGGGEMPREKIISSIEKIVDLMK